MIKDARVDFQLMAKPELENIKNGMAQKNDHYHRLISTISALNRRPEVYSIVILVTDSTFSADTNCLPDPLRIMSESLTKREREVYSLAIRGLSNKLIAEKLFITTETVRSHRKHIVKKARVSKIEDIKNLILDANNLIA